MSELLEAGKAVWECPPVLALELATVYGDEVTSLVSLARCCVVGGFEGEHPQQGIPHLYLTGDMEKAAAEEAGWAYDGNWPGWEFVVAYIRNHRDLLSTDHYSEETRKAVKKAGTNDPRLVKLAEELARAAERTEEIQLAVDDLVYDQIGTSKAASNLNNQGIGGQAEALAERCGVVDAIQLLQGVKEQFGVGEKKGKRKG